MVVHDERAELRLVQPAKGLVKDAFRFYASKLLYGRLSQPFQKDLLGLRMKHPKQALQAYYTPLIFHLERI